METFFSWIVFIFLLIVILAIIATCGTVSEKMADKKYLEHKKEQKERLGL